MMRLLLRLYPESGLFVGVLVAGSSPASPSGSVEPQICRIEQIGLGGECLARWNCGRLSEERDGIGLGGVPCEKDLGKGGITWDEVGRGAMERV